MPNFRSILRSQVRKVLEDIVGFDNFRFYFSRWTIRWLHRNKIEADFYYFLDLVPTDKVVLDIGANFGIMTVLLAQKASKGQVYSFEPINENAKALKRLVRHYKLKNVSVVECAVGNDSGRSKMVLPLINNVKIHGLSHMVEGYDEHEGEVHTVPVIRLDDMSELKSFKPIAAIKIDVENHEYEVLTGARDLLLKHRPIILCEIWDNPKREKTLKYLKDELDYEIKIFDGEKLVLFTDQDALNFFIIPKTSVFNDR